MLYFQSTCERNVFPSNSRSFAIDMTILEYFLKTLKLLNFSYIMNKLELPRYENFLCHLSCKFMSRYEHIS